MFEYYIQTCFIFLLNVYIQTRILQHIIFFQNSIWFRYRSCDYIVLYTCIIDMRIIVLYYERK